MNTQPMLLGLSDCRRIELAGGKAVNLARLLDAGLPVPEGFVVTAAAFRTCRQDGRISARLAEEITERYCTLGSPVVAVRSSATAEDLAEASMAGQYKTVLGVQGESEVLRAIEECWASLETDRTRAYLAEQRIDPAAVAMAVVVQRLVPADVAGVLFTANPRTGSVEEMLLEASWGLGEAVVSGMAQPDTLVLDHATGRVKSVALGDKQTAVLLGSPRPQPVPEEKRRVACLTSRQVYDLWQLGRRAAEHFGSPQDIEWAIHEDRVYLLQSRPITTLRQAAAERECVEDTQRQLRARKREGRGDWVRHNLGETLPHPTPLTWSVVRRFMSGDGGFGRMYRMVGFEPSDAVRDDGFLDLIAGRIYMDLSRAPEMFFAGFPYRYDLDLLRSDPDAAQGPPTLPGGSAIEQYRIGRRLATIQRKLAALAEDFDRRFDGRIVPDFTAYVEEEKRRDLAPLNPIEWKDLWTERQRKVLQEFGPQSLLPSLIAAMAMERLRALLEEHFWDEDPRVLAVSLVVGEPDRTLLASQGLYELAHGKASLDAWLEAFGHRGPDEFDLASPRWREQPEAVLAMAERLRDGPSPLEMHHRRAADATVRLAELGRRLRGAERRELEEYVRLAGRYIRFREDGKHFLMLGYGLLRDLALEAGRRLEIGADVFLLTLEELEDSLATGFAPLHLIDQRRRRRAAETKLFLPQVIREAEIDQLGQSQEIPHGDHCRAMPISSGVSTGPARIVHSPQEAGDLGRGYVLVCPSTDPSWTPLFIHAAGLVLECGGTLSHGAVVARELGIPAVVCPGATRAFEENEPLHVDGNRGAIIRVGQAASLPAVGQVSNLPTVGQVSNLPRDNQTPQQRDGMPAAGWKPAPRLQPPLPGGRERRGAQVRNASLAIWAAFLAAAFLLPEQWLYRPAMDLLDSLLWPVVAAWGKPAAVAVVALGLAAVTMIGQRLLTDNARLRVAKDRAAELRRLAAKEPAGSPDRTAMLRLAAPVQWRIVGASLVSLAAVLGPMVLTFLWFPDRVDPASWNARPGATAYVIASVDGEFTRPITLELDPALRLDESTPAAQSLPPIRTALEARLAQWQRASDLSGLPWEVREAARLIGNDLREDLRDYLSRDLPPQALAWTLYTPQDAGRFPILLAADDEVAAETAVVVGDASPPEPKEDLGEGKGPVQIARPSDPKSPVQWMKVVYSDQQQGRRVFWAPLARLGWPDWDAGWLLTYILSYVPAMLVLRRALRLP